MPIGDIKAGRDYYYWLRQWGQYMSRQTIYSRIHLNGVTFEEHRYGDVVVRGL